MDRQISSERSVALQTKTGSVGLTPSDDLFMRGDGRRFGDGVSLWQLAYRVWQYIWLFYRSPGNLKPIQLVSIGLCEDCVCGAGFRPRQPKVHTRPTKRGLGPIARPSGLIVADCLLS